MVSIVDETRKFSEAEQNELINFVTQQLLLTEREHEWLTIKICYKPYTNWDGYWKGQFEYNNQNEIEARAVIVLNAFHLITLDNFKKTLAHEYGHHWTISWLAIRTNLVNYIEQRLPDDYYCLRNLNEQDYAPDYSKHWERCDKEVIAEDYRIFFAPPPYNQNHEIIVRLQEFGQVLEEPRDEVRDYIENLPNLT